MADPPGKIIRTGRLQRWTAQAAGPDWALLPHAAGFVDPLHSTGIAHTLSGIERLMNILGRCWQRPALAPALETYSRSVVTELEFIDLMVNCCYRSMADFRLWAASTMLYFAAATSYERVRTAGGDAAGDRLFLLADEPGLFEAAVEASRYLTACTDVVAYERLVQAAVRPFNHVGLFHPDVPNMYTHTAART